ncbi:MAG: hypothetical protein R2710_22905 [Acidimicrobiales bacterium]
MGKRSTGSAVVLNVRRHNPRAIAAYQRLGFVATVEQAEDPSEIVMVRPLDSEYVTDLPSVLEHQE